MIEKLIVPQVGVNDDFINIYFNKDINYSLCNKSQLIAKFESTKSSFEYEILNQGFLVFLVNNGEKVKVGTPFALFSSDLELLKSEFLSLNSKSNFTNDFSGINITEKAKALVLSSQLNINELPKDRLLNTSDIEKIISSKNPGMVIPLPNINSEKHILLLGAGGISKLIIDSIIKNTHYEILGFLDNKLPANSSYLGYQILGNDDQLKNFYDKGLRNLFLCFGATFNHSVRLNLFTKLKQVGFIFPNIIHPLSYFDESVLMGEGNFVSVHANVGPNVKLGNMNFILDSAVISHDCILENNVYVSPGAVLAGNVTVQSNTLLGMNTSYLVKVNIGQNVKIFNGVSVFTSVPDNTIVKSNWY